MHVFERSSRGAAPPSLKPKPMHASYPKSYCESHIASVVLITYTG